MIKNRETDKTTSVEKLKLIMISLQICKPWVLFQLLQLKSKDLLMSFQLWLHID